MARQGRFNRGSHMSRRKTDWREGPGSTDGTIVALSASGSAVLGTGIGVNSGELTLVRTRGFFAGYLGSATAVQDGYWGALGIGITTVQAFTDVGITALPIPFDDVEWDGWLYHRYFSAVAGASGSVEDDRAFTRFEIDSKAMRKLSDNEVIFAVVQVVENTSVTLEIQFASCMLFKLP